MSNKATSNKRPVFFKKTGLKTGFTLVELIVVISILAILGIIAFLSFNGFASSARDSTRITDINSVSKAFELFKVKGGSYPTPSVPTQDIVYSGGTVWTQGKLGDSVIQNLGNQISKKPTDPSTGLEYDYSLTSLTQEYQIKANFEKTITYLPLLTSPYQGEELANNSPSILRGARGGNLVDTAQAASTTVNVYLKGNYNEIFTKTLTGSVIYYIATPSLFINSGSLNLTGTGYYLVNKLSYDSSSSSTGGIAFMPQLIYSSTGAPSTDSQFLTFATNLKSIYQTYSGTLINNNQGISTLLSTPDTDTGALTNIGKAVISLKPISVPTTDNQTQTFTCTGTAPTPATGLTQSTTQPTDNTTNWTYSSTTSTTGPACTWKCDTGYTQNGNTCSAKLYVDDVFSTNLYTGNGGTQTITNGIDLAGNGGMVWVKGRGPLVSLNHTLWDTARGPNKQIGTERTTSETDNSPYGVTFNNNGFNISGTNNNLGNGSGQPYVSWTFRKAPKFFDVVTWTGSNTSSRNIPHSLGIAPGMVIVKATSGGTGNGYWLVYHKSATGNLYLNVTNQQEASHEISVSSSNFTLAGNSYNESGATYVAYIFAHDTNTDGIIQAGTLTADSTGAATINLGWEPQYILTKRVDTAGDWWVRDSMRGLSMTNNVFLYPNTTATDADGGTAYGNPTATGFNWKTGYANSTYIYLAIRRPNKPVTDPTKVFQPVVWSGVGGTGNRVITTGNVTPDLFFLNTNRISGSSDWFYDRMRGSSAYLQSQNTLTESSYDGVGFDRMNSIALGTGNFDNSGQSYAGWSFCRAPGFFDMVAYTGNGVAGTQIRHNLDVVPELMIVKSRVTPNMGGVDGYWLVYNKDIGNNQSLFLNTTDSKQGDASWNNTTPSITTFNVDNYNNFSGKNYIAYLFATLPNVSKVGSYVGSSSNVPVSCDFTSSPRFLLVKRTDGTGGDWFVWDSARGFDKRLSLNTTAAEVTGDTSITTSTSGFIANTGGVVNANGGNYIFLCVH